MDNEIENGVYNTPGANVEDAVLDDNKFAIEEHLLLTELQKVWDTNGSKMVGLLAHANSLQEKYWGKGT